MIFQSEWIPVLMITLILLTILIIVCGYKNGFLLTLCDFLSTILCLIGAMIFSNHYSDTIVIVKEEFLASLLPEQILSSFVGEMNQMVLFLIAFFIFKIIFRLFRPLLRGINEIPLIGFLNKGLGFILGIAQAFLMLLIVTMIFSSSLVLNGNYVLNETKLIYFKQISNSIMTNLSDNYEPLEHLYIPEDVEEYANVKEWLYTYDFSDEEIDEIIKIIENRSE